MSHDGFPYKNIYPSKEDSDISKKPKLNIFRRMWTTSGKN